MTRYKGWDLLPNPVKFSLCFFFRWPRTLAGIKAYLPCNRLPTSAGTYSGSSVEEQRAWRYCDREGLWAEEDYSHCEFQKDVTRFLYLINQVCVSSVQFSSLIFSKCKRVTNQCLIVNAFFSIYLLDASE